MEASGGRVLTVLLTLTRSVLLLSLVRVVGHPSR
jgi:hypothetical protein